MDQIKHTLVQIRDRLNEFFRELSGDDDFVVLSNVVDQQGQPVAAAKNHLVMFLANIQHETTISTYNRTVPLSNDSYAVVAKPIYINLYVLLFANFESPIYEQGLGVISRTISFFQQNPSFNHTTMPELSSGIDKLTFELTNLDLTELNYLMGLLGTKYLPSVFYKVRMLPFDSDALHGEVPAVRRVGTPGEPRDEQRRLADMERQNLADRKERPS